MGGGTLQFKGDNNLPCALGSKIGGGGTLQIKII